MQVRWDWTNDGTWDTNYSTDKTQSHQFSAAGIYSVKLEVIDTRGATNSMIKSISVSTNTLPHAEFSIYPEVGFEDITEFIFDASNSYDLEDEVSTLRIRWDWENNGTWDTEYDTVKTITHIFNHPKTYEVKLEVIDSFNDVNTYVKDVQVNPFGPDLIIDITSPLYYSPWYPDSSAYEFTFSVTNIGNAPGNLGGDTDEMSDNVIIQKWLSSDSLYSNNDIGAGGRVLGWDGTPLGELLPNEVYNDKEQFFFESLEEEISTAPYLIIKIDYGNRIDELDENNNYAFIKIEKPNTLIDIDGNVYNTVQIGNQIWMAENLKVTHYRNGEALPNVTSNSEWINLTSGAYCNYGNDESYVSTYGRLYNWWAVDDSRSLAPEGWHIPSDEEWKELEMYLGMSQSEADIIGIRGTDEGNKIKSTEGWYDGGNGTNESGFNALPGGWRNLEGNIIDLYNYAVFWTSTEYSTIGAWYRNLHYSYSKIYHNETHNKHGFSVRCIKD